ncbi:MAG: cell division protein ZapA [Sphingomonadaceae bacterium]
MAEVQIVVGGRPYSIVCRDGGEDHLRTIAAHVDRKAAEARAAVGDVNENRQLLFAALLLADEISENAGVPAAGAPDPALARALGSLADRIEGIADALEQRALAS